MEKVRVKENPPYRPVVQDGDAEKAANVQCVLLSVAEIVEKVRVKENPPYRPAVQDGDAEEAANIQCVLLSVAEIVEKVRVKENPPYRPAVQDGDAEEAFLDLMRICWEEIPAFRPNFPIINDSLKKMNKGR